MWHTMWHSIWPLEPTFHPHPERTPRSTRKLKMQYVRPPVHILFLVAHPHIRHPHTMHPNRPRRPICDHPKLQQHCRNQPNRTTRWMNPKLTKTRNPDQKHRHTKQQPITDNEKNIIIMIIHYTILIAQPHHLQNNCTHTSTPPFNKIIWWKPPANTNNQPKLKYKTSRYVTLYRDVLRRDVRFPAWSHDDVT